MNVLGIIADLGIKADEVGIPTIGKDTVIKGILNGVYFWAGVVAVVVIVAAGFFYVTSNGNAQQVARAKNAILGSVIGLVVVMMAFAITSIVLRGVK